MTNGIIQDMLITKTPHWIYVDFTILYDGILESILAAFPQKSVDLLGGGKIPPIAGVNPYIFHVGDTITVTKVYQDGILFGKDFAHYASTISAVCDNNFHIVTWLQENIIFPIQALSWYLTHCLDGFCRYGAIAHGIVVLSVCIVVFLIIVLYIVKKIRHGR